MISWEWENALYVLIVTGMLASPALVALPWAWFTRIQRVRKLLIGAFLIALVAPPIAAGLFRMFLEICGKGHIDQKFGDCGAIPDIVANLVSFGFFYLLLSFVGIIALYCAYLEIRRFMRPE